MKPSLARVPAKPDLRLARRVAGDLSHFLAASSESGESAPHGERRAVGLRAARGQRDLLAGKLRIAEREQLSILPRGRLATLLPETQRHTRRRRESQGPPLHHGAAVRQAKHVEHQPMNWPVGHDDQAGDIGREGIRRVGSTVSRPGFGPERRIPASFEHRDKAPDRSGERICGRQKVRTRSAPRDDEHRRGRASCARHVLDQCGAVVRERGGDLARGHGMYPVRLRARLPHPPSASASV